MAKAFVTLFRITTLGNNGYRARLTRQCSMQQMQHPFKGWVVLTLLSCEAYYVYCQSPSPCPPQIYQFDSAIDTVSF